MEVRMRKATGRSSPVKYRFYQSYCLGVIGENVSRVTESRKDFGTRFFFLGVNNEFKKEFKN